MFVWWCYVFLLFNKMFWGVVYVLVFLLKGKLSTHRKTTTFFLKDHISVTLSLTFVNIVHIGYINPTHFSQKMHGFIYETSCLFTFCPYSINVTETTWKCVTTLVKKDVCVKNLLHANIRARKAALLRNYFSRRNHFRPNGSRLPSLSLPLRFLTR